MLSFLRTFLWLAACGLALSFMAHLIALTGTTVPGGEGIWALHMGALVVCLPVGFISLRAARHTKRGKSWKLCAAGCPLWMRRAGYALFGYTALNFIILIATANDTPEQHSRPPPPFVVRAFSGHWMFFYGIAFITYYAHIHAPHLFRGRTCPQGHIVSPIAPVCPECGHAMSPMVADTSPSS